jgi:hypothetical protein
VVYKEGNQKSVKVAYSQANLLLDNQKWLKNVKLTLNMLKASIKVNVDDILYEEAEYGNGSPLLLINTEQNDRVIIILL